METLSLLFVPPTERRRNGDYYEKRIITGIIRGANQEGSLAKEEGMELTDEQLEAVSGGGCFRTLKCKKCGSKNIKETIEDREILNQWSDESATHAIYRCRECGYEWHTM